jgi:hypothetical protein
MPDLTPLPNPSCGAIAPDGQMCPSDSAAIIAAEWPTTGYATLTWRCDDHIGASVEAAHQLSPQSVITVTPLAAIDDTTDNSAADTAEGSAQHASDPTPDSPTAGRPTLRLIP